MSNQIKTAFEAIHAEENLKTKTKDYLVQNAFRREREKKIVRYSLLPAVACLLFIFLRKKEDKGES